jgi:hypothetical protein
VNLGFTRQQALDAVERALPHVGPNAELEPLIRVALRHVSLGASKECSQDPFSSQLPKAGLHGKSQDLFLTAPC